MIEVDYRVKTTLQIKTLRGIELKSEDDMLELQERVSEEFHEWVTNQGAVEKIKNLIFESLVDMAAEGKVRLQK